MKYIIFITFLPLSLFSQDFGVGYELLSAGDVNYTYYVNNFHPASPPNQWETPEEVIRERYFGTDIELIKPLYTDLNEGGIKLKTLRLNSRKKKQDQRNLTFKINSTIEFTYKKEDFVYIRSSILEDNQYFSSKQNLLVKEANGWKICGIKKGQEIKYRPITLKGLSKLKPKIFYHLFTGELSGEPNIDSVIKTTRFKDGFDIDHFRLLIKKWKDEDNQKMIEYFFYQ